MDKYNFNGGKLYHIFKTISIGKKMFYTNEYLSEESQEAFEKGKALLKVDGECAVLHRELDDNKYKWIFYRRQDNYKGNDRILSLPNGKQSDKYDQGGKNHYYQFLKISENYATGKGKNKSEVGKIVYQSIKKGVEGGYLPDPKINNCPEWITCEWVGSKHQTNIDGIPYEHGIVPHYEPFVPKIEIKSMEKFMEISKEKYFEGVVIQHPNGIRYKLRCNMISEKNKCERTDKRKNTDPGATDIRPKVLTMDGLLIWNGMEWLIS